MTSTLPLAFSGFVFWFQRDIRDPVFALIKKR
jgi:hypothetical protein